MLAPRRHEQPRRPPIRHARRRSFALGTPGSPQPRAHPSPPASTPPPSTPPSPLSPVATHAYPLTIGPTIAKPLLDPHSTFTHSMLPSPRTPDPARRNASRSSSRTSNQHTRPPRHTIADPRTPPARQRVRLDVDIPPIAIGHRPRETSRRPSHSQRGATDPTSITRIPTTPSRHQEGSLPPRTQHARQECQETLPPRRAPPSSRSSPIPGLPSAPPSDSGCDISCRDHKICCQRADSSPRRLLVAIEPDRAPASAAGSRGESMKPLYPSPARAHPAPPPIPPTPPTPPAHPSTAAAPRHPSTSCSTATPTSPASPKPRSIRSTKTSSSWLTSSTRSQPRRMWIHGESESPHRTLRPRTPPPPKLARAPRLDHRAAKALAATEPNAQVYLYFSGHGGRTQSRRRPQHPALRPTRTRCHRTVASTATSTAASSPIEILAPLSKRADVHLLVDTCMSFFLSRPAPPLARRSAASAKARRPPIASPVSPQAPPRRRLPRRPLCHLRSTRHQWPLQPCPPHGCAWHRRPQRRRQSSPTASCTTRSSGCSATPPTPPAHRRPSQPRPETTFIDWRNSPAARVCLPCIPHRHPCHRHPPRTAARASRSTPCDPEPSGSTTAKLPLIGKHHDWSFLATDGALAINPQWHHQPWHAFQPMFTDPSKSPTPTRSRSCPPSNPAGTWPAASPAHRRLLQPRPRPAHPHRPRPRPPRPRPTPPRPRNRLVIPRRARRPIPPASAK
jgi:hypothetical protein